MKKRNPIGTLLRLREIRERKARADLGSAQGSVQQAAETMAERRARLRQGISPGDELPLTMLRAMHLRGLDSAEQVAAAARELESANQRLSAERGKWRSASADLDATEELDRRNRRVHAAKARAASERALDELMAARYREKRP